MNEDNFSIKVAAGLTQMGNNTFPILRARDVDVSGVNLTKFLPISLTQNEYDTLVQQGYLDLKDGNEEITETIFYDPEQIYFIKPIINM